MVFVLWVYGDFDYLLVFFEKYICFNDGFCLITRFTVLMFDISIGDFANVVSFLLLSFGFMK
jgi:hypothetical protein